MSRIQRYLNNIVIIPLYQRNFNLDEEAIDTSGYDIIARDLISASISAKSNLSVVSNSLRSDCEFKCEVSDFQKQTEDYFITNPKANKTIKCRIKKYLLGNNIFDRLFPDVQRLSNNLNIVNQIRLETENSILIPERLRHTENSNSDRTFGFLKVYDKKDNRYIFMIKGINGRTSFPSELNFAPIPKEPRIFDDVITIPERVLDTEVKMLEFLPQKYPNTDIPEIDIDVFTDRKTCTSCENVLSSVNLLLRNTHLIEPILGIYESGEKIPTPRDPYFYSNLLK